MKKLILCVLFLLICSVCAAAPAKKVVLWYQVPDAILEVQNPENDMEKGKAELEAFIKTNYGKRFDIQIVKRAPEKNLTAADVSLVTRPNWVPVIVKIDLAGVGTGEKLVGNMLLLKLLCRKALLSTAQFIPMITA